MRGTRGRLAMIAALAGGIVSCEALVGIHERELATSDAVSSDSSTEQPAAEIDASGADAPLGTVSDGAIADHVVMDVDVDARIRVDAGADARGPTDAGGNGGGETGIADAGGSSDGADAAMPTDPDVPCSQQPSFLYCNDFDSVSSVGQTWDFAYNSPDSGATLQVDGTEYVSPPHSVQVIASTVTAIADIQLGKDVGMLYTGCRLAFDLRVDVSSLVGIPQVGVAQLYLARAVDPLQVNFVVGPGATSNVSVYGSADAGPPQNLSFAAPTPMTWARIVIVYDSTAGISVFRNGQLLGTVSVGPGAPGDTKIIMGNPFINPGGTQGLTTEEDNIVISGH